jgi:hypothetical protein
MTDGLEGTKGPRPWQSTVQRVVTTEADYVQPPNQSSPWPPFFGRRPSELSLPIVSMQVPPQHPHLDSEPNADRSP